MAISTYMTFLMHKSTGATYNKLVDIKSFPDLGGTPENLETTTLSDRMQTFIAGILSGSGALEFDANYDKTDFSSLKALEGKTESYAVWFGGTESGDTVTPTGDQGKFAFDGQLAVYPVGGGVNEVVGMKVAIVPSTPISFAQDA